MEQAVREMPAWQPSVRGQTEDKGTGGEQAESRRADDKPSENEQKLESLPQPGLWESLCRYYPKTAPELRREGVELLQIRPADLRYLPRRLWHFGSNSFLLHGYYHYRHLILGRISRDGGQEYILGVRGTKDDRERFSAGLFGFGNFLTADEDGYEGYWYTKITLDGEK